MDLAAELQEWFKNNDINDLDNPITKIIKDNLLEKDRWKRSPKMCQGKSKALFFEEAWNDMPEYTMNDLMPIKALKVNFLTWDDYSSFSKLINQKLTPKTKSVWYPKQETIKPSDFVYECVNNES